jgi:hypothetical protein
MRKKKVFLKIPTNRPTDQTRPDQTKPTNRPTKPKKRLKQRKKGINHIKGKGKGKGKAVPLQAWSVPEGSRKLKLPDFMTAAQVGDKVVSLTHGPPLSRRNVRFALLSSVLTKKIDVHVTCLLNA